MRHAVERSKVVRWRKCYREQREVIGHGGGEKRGSGSYGVKVCVRVGNKV